jgi:hypothetical protein
MESVRNNMKPLVLVLLARYECSPLLMNHYGEVNTPNAFTEYSVDRVSVLSRRSSAVYAARSSSL